MSLGIDVGSILEPPLHQTPCSGGLRILCMFVLFRIVWIKKWSQSYEMNLPCLIFFAHLFSYHFNIMLNHCLMSCWHHVGSIREPFGHHVGTLLGHILILFRFSYIYIYIYITQCLFYVLYKLYSYGFKLVFDAFYIVIQVFFYIRDMYGHVHAETEKLSQRPWRYL